MQRQDSLSDQMQTVDELAEAAGCRDAAEWIRRAWAGAPAPAISDVLIEQAAFELYAAGPWGSDLTIIEGGLRALTDSHSMDTYRRLAREVLTAAFLEER